MIDPKQTQEIDMNYGTEFMRGFLIVAPVCTLFWAGIATLAVATFTH